MKVVGISHTTNSNGVKNFTIYGTEEFEAYYNNQAEGRCAKQLMILLINGLYPYQ